MRILSSTKAGTAAGVMMALLAPVSAHSQVQPTEPVPAVTVTSTGEIQVTPDRARIQVGVETEAKTAAVAGSENSKKQTAVLAAIRALGIPQNQITTLNYSVQPIQRWNETLKRSEIIGYRVSNIVQIDADRVDQTGPIIDAGLKAGANRVAGLEFRLSDQAKYRDSALTLAVQNARRQAEVAARAAGGSATDLIELNIMDMGRPEPRPVMMAMKVANQEADTPINEGTMTVTVMVNTRWKYIKR